MTFDSYKLEKDSVVPGRILTRFADNSCREAWPVEILVSKLEERIVELEKKVQGVSAVPPDCPVTEEPTKAEDGKINVNTADSVELESVIGIGEVTAARIIQAREEAPFTDLEDFKVRAEISGSSATKILDQVEV